MNRVKLTGLWKNTTKIDGHEYLSGNLSATATLQIWPNKFKRTDKDPDFNIFLVQKEPKKPEGTPPPSNSTPPSVSSGIDYLNEIPF